MFKTIFHNCHILSSCPDSHNAHDKELIDNYRLFNDIILTAEVMLKS